ncbi:RNA polymerase sigma factor [Actinosynnema sp. CS-041913]|uniref:RNA polymerase sigma factor n=1 Tax=Actinosynnema sp. CS-041913 TaxID=3239917 RepID=UPI003D9007B3
MRNDMDVAAESDAVLWARVSAADDVHAFADLHARHVDRVYRHCFARIGVRVDAEEAAGQVFYEAWRQRRKVLVSEDGMLPWLFTVAGNVAANHLRGARRRGALLRRIAGTRDVDGLGDVEGRLDSQRHTAALRRAIARLNGAGQAVIGLCVIEGYSYDEAARHLGVPVGTVRSRLSRAKARLRAELAAQGLDFEPGDV